MQQDAREHDRPAGRCAVEAAAEFRETEIASLIVLIQIDGHRKPTMGGARGGVVAMRSEVAADAGIVAGHDVTLDAGRLELEGAFDLRR